MKASAKVRVRESLLVILGFAAWITLGIASHGGTLEPAGISYFGGAFVFFLIAFFIPERPRGSFIRRSQVIGVAAFLLWIGLNHLFYFGEYSLSQHFDSTVSDLALGVSLVAAPFVFYWGAHFLIRGFYADQAYSTNEEAEQGVVRDPPPAPSSAKPSDE